MKNILITGGTVNTGLAIARQFAQNGYGIAITSRDQKKAERTASELASEFSVPAKGYGLSFTSANEIREVFLSAERDLGSIDVFVANAAHLGINFGVMNTDEQSFCDIVDVNIKGTFFCCQAAAEVMKRHGGGNIVTIGSVQGTGAVRGRAVYSMTKAAISLLVKNIAFELGEYNIRANNVVAGAIHSDRWNALSAEEIAARRARYPVGRESTEQEIANAVYFLGTDQSASITGTDLTVDSGISVCILPYSKEST
ncbi:MAG: SDR family oxidoreductase [Ruminococcaceae bacterium]|nr:SDR family oxidoreductase [Oscillospiraceae bacterium]